MITPNLLSTRSGSAKDLGCTRLSAPLCHQKTPSRLQRRRFLSLKTPWLSCKARLPPPLTLAWGRSRSAARFLFVSSCLVLARKWKKKMAPSDECSRVHRRRNWRHTKWKKKRKETPIGVSGATALQSRHGDLVTSRPLRGRDACAGSFLSSRLQQHLRLR